METSHNFYCQICNIPLNGEIQANQHYAGEKHLRRQRQLSDGWLDTAEMTSGDSISGSVLEFNGTSGMCHICKVALTSSIVYEQHVNGKNHAKALEIWKKAQDKVANQSPPPAGTVSSDRLDKNTNPATEQSFETIKSKWKDELTFSEKCYTFNPRARKGLCLACKLSFTDFIEFQHHLKTKPHKDKEKSWSP